jgi:hypothetical protein
MGDPSTFELPDIEYVLIQWLKLQSLSASTVGSQLPVGYDGTQSVVTLDRLGGGIDNSLPYFLDRARVDVSCYGQDKADAWDLTSKVRRLILRSYMDGNFRPWNARITNVNELVGPQWLIEPEYGAAGRYLVQFEVTLHTVTP